MRFAASLGSRQTVNNSSILTITHQRFTGWVRRLVRWVLSLSKIEFLYVGGGGRGGCFELWMWFYVWCVSFDVYFKRLAPFCTLLQWV